MKPANVPKRLSLKKNALNTQYKSLRLGFEDEGCPFGTVPIKRTIKEDLIRAKLYHEMFNSKINVVERLGTHVRFSLTQSLNILFDVVIILFLCK